MQSTLKPSLKFQRISDMLIIFVAVFLGVLYVISAGDGFPLDDSWIHQTYGRNLAQTGEWAFTPGVPSAASTSALYTVILSVGYKLNLPFLVWTHGVGIFALALSGVVANRFGHFFDRTGRLGLCLGLAIVFAWHLIWSAVSGMETAIFNLMTLVVIYLAWHVLTAPQKTTREILLHSLCFGIASAILTLTRPEGILLVGLTGMVIWLTRSNRVWDWRQSVTTGIVFIIAMSPYLALNMHLTGGLLPDTAAAKLASIRPLLALSYVERVNLLIQPLLAGGQVLLIPGLIFFIVKHLRQVAQRDFKSAFFLLLPLWVVALIALYAAWLPAHYQHGRYVIPAVPSWIIAGGIGTYGLIRAGRHSFLGRTFSRVLALTSALIFVFCAFVLGLSAYKTDVAIINEEMVATAHWVDENIPESEFVAIHDIGAVGYFTERPILDIAGLVSPEVVPALGDPEALWSLIEDRGAVYLIAFPDQIPNDDPSDPRLCEVFSTQGVSAIRAGGANMRTYRLAWDRNC